MYKSVKLQEAVYNRLTELLRGKESYSQVVERLLLVYEKLGVLTSQFEGNVRYLQEAAAKLEAQKATH